MIVLAHPYVYNGIAIDTWNYLIELQFQQDGEFFMI